MDEKILQAYCGVSITPVERYRKSLEMANGDEQFLGFILGYHAALDALPSRGEIEKVAERIIEKYAEHFSAQNVDCAVCSSTTEIATAIDALIRGKE